MPSTYTTNNGIELPATGEQSGTWGDTVNTNMSIVDRLVTGVGTITLSGTTHTLTTTSGTLSDGMYRVLVFSGSPSGTNTVTISPNTQQKYYIVKNSSGQSVVLTQGSGGNVTVANGDVKIVYANGGGASAAVVDLTADLAMSSVNITGGTIDGSVIGGSSAAAGTFTTATVGAGLVGTPSLTTTGDTNTGLYFPSADTVAATTGGTERLRVDSSGNVGIATASPSSFGKFAVQGASTTRAFYADALAQPVARYDDNSYVSNGLTIRNTGVSGSNQGIGLLFQLGAGGTAVDSGAIQMRSEADYSTAANQDAAMAFFTVANGTNSERIRIDSSGNVGIGTSGPVDLLQVNRGSGSGITSGISLSTAAGGVGDGSYIKWTGAGTSEKIARIDGVQEGTDVGSIRFNTGNGADGFAERMRINSSGNVGIGTSSPNNKLHVNGSVTLTSNYMTYLVNAYYDSSWKYVENGIAWGIGNNFGGPSDGVTIAAAASNSGGAGAALTWLPRLSIESTGRLKVSYASNGVVTALTDGATITPDFNAANNYSLTIGGNRTLANPTNITAGQSGAIVITQDSTGGRTLAYGSYWKFPGGTIPTLTTTASAVDVLVYYVESTTRITATMLNDVK